MQQAAKLHTEEGHSNPWAASDMALMSPFRAVSLTNRCRTWALLHAAYR